MRCKPYLIGIVVLTLAGAAGAQTVQVNQQNRTIELSTESTIQVQADLVKIDVGYHNYAPTHDAAYQNNIRASAQILKAWTDVGMSEKDVSTDSLSLRAVSDDELKNIAPSERKVKQFEANNPGQSPQTGKWLNDFSTSGSQPARTRWAIPNGSFPIQTALKPKPTRQRSRKPEPSRPRWRRHSERK